MNYLIDTFMTSMGKGSKLYAPNEVKTGLMATINQASQNTESRLAHQYYIQSININSLMSKNDINEIALNMIKYMRENGFYDAPNKLWLNDALAAKKCTNFIINTIDNPIINIDKDHLDLFHKINIHPETATLTA